MSDLESYPTIVGVGMFVPEQGQLSNQELIDRIGIQSTPDWIEQHTGIKRRYWAPDGVLASDMATAASREAMDMAGMATHDLASLHLATTSPDYPTPSTASIAHGNLGAPEACAAVEIRAACAGFIMGMVAASNGLRMQPEDGSTALVVGTELTSRRVNPHDRRSAILFGDGAGAVVLRMQPGASRPASASLVHPDREAVYTPAGGCAQPVDGPDDMKGRLVMDGPAVKKHALDIMTCVSRMSAFKAGLLDGNGKIDWSQIDLFVPHQANQRLIEDVGQLLDVPPEKCVVTVDRYGNTSSASIPMALTVAHREGLITPGRKRALLTTIGAGMVGGAVIIDIDLPQTHYL